MQQRSNIFGSLCMGWKSEKPWDGSLVLGVQGDLGAVSDTRLADRRCPGSASASLVGMTCSGIKAVGRVLCSLLPSIQGA